MASSLSVGLRSSADLHLVIVDLFVSLHLSLVDLLIFMLIDFCCRGGLIGVSVVLLTSGLRVLTRFLSVALNGRSCA